MHRSNGIVITPNNLVMGSAAIPNVPVEPANEADIGFDMEVDLRVEKIRGARRPESVKIPSRITTFAGPTRWVSRRAARFLIVNRDGDVDSLLQLGKVIA